MRPGHLPDWALMTKQAMSMSQTIVGNCKDIHVEHHKSRHGCMMSMVYDIFAVSATEYVE
jgi:hypothetical protein